MDFNVVIHLLLFCLHYLVFKNLKSTGKSLNEFEIETYYGGIGKKKQALSSAAVDVFKP